MDRRVVILFIVAIVVISMIDAKCSLVSGVFCMNLTLSSEGKEDEVTAVVEVIENRILQISYSGKAINLRDQGVKIWRNERSHCRC